MVCKSTVALKVMFLSIDMDIQKGYPPFCDGITERLKQNGVVMFGEAKWGGGVIVFHQNPHGCNRNGMENEMEPWKTK